MQTENIGAQLFGPPIDDAQMAKLITDKNYGLEQKADGCRVIVYKNSHGVYARSRSFKPITLNKEIRAVLEKAPADFIADGELVKDRSGRDLASLVLFDLLFLDGQDIRQEGFRGRKLQLTTLFPTNKPPVYVMQTVWKPAEKKLAAQLLKEGGAEGIVFKHQDSKYVAGRPTGTSMWWRRKWVVSATVQVTRHDPIKDAAFYRYSDTAEIGSFKLYSNKQKPKPGELISIRYLYADSHSRALIQPVYEYIRKDVTVADSVNSLQYKAALRKGK